MPNMQQGRSRIRPSLPKKKCNPAQKKRCLSPHFYLGEQDFRPEKNEASATLECIRSAGKERKRETVLLLGRNFNLTGWLGYTERENSGRIFSPTALPHISISFLWPVQQGTMQFWGIGHTKKDRFDPKEKGSESFF